MWVSKVKYDLTPAKENEIIGNYVHRQLEESIGASGCWLLLSIPSALPIYPSLADKLAIHYFGIKSEYFYEDQLPAALVEEEHAKIKASTDLSNKPAEIAEKILKGKFQKFLEDRVMESQLVGFEESDFLIKEYIAQKEKQAGGEAGKHCRILKATRFGL